MGKAQRDAQGLTAKQRRRIRRGLRRGNTRFIRYSRPTLSTDERVRNYKAQWFALAEARSRTDPYPWLGAEAHFEPWVSPRG